MSSFGDIVPNQRSSTLRGEVTVRLYDAEGHRNFQVPDPEELPAGIPLSPGQMHILRFIRDGLEPCATSLNAAFETQHVLSNDTGSAQGNLNGSEGDRFDGHSTVGLDAGHEGSAVLASDPATGVMSHMQVDDGAPYRLPAGIRTSEVKKFLMKVSTAVEIGPVGQKRVYRFHGRNQMTKRSPSKLRKKRMERVLREGNPFTTGIWKCCSRYRCFKTIGFERCLQEYKIVNSMNPKQAKRHLISLYDQSEKKFRVGGHAVCARFLAKALGYSNDVQCSIKNTPKARGSAIAQFKPREVKRKTKRVFIELFIRHLAKLFGDAMPHKEQITLPVLSRKALWLECKEAWKNNGGQDSDEELSKCYFYRIWRAYVEFVSVRKHHGFTECSRCEMLRGEMAKHLQDEETLITLIDLHAAHLRFIEKERNAYEGRQALAEQNPGRYCSIIIDGADQKNYGLPHFARNTKSDSGHKLKVKVVGVLEHVLRGQEWLSLFAMTEEYETGANHIVEVAHRTLQRKKEKLGKLPPTLFVQVDNCIRENKNRYFMAYFQSLVHLGVFKMVQISFLPIGHTHADIDQTFSSISTHLKLNDAITMPDMLGELDKCYARRVTTSELDRVVNYSGLCEQSGCLDVVDAFSEYRYFRFIQKDCGGTAGLHGSECDVKVKDSDTWIPFPTSKAEGFLKFVPNFGQTPATETKQLLNMAEVTKCLKSAEERVKNDAKMEMLRELQAKVYQTREEQFHWQTNACFEMNGDYVDSTHTGDEIMQNSHVDEAIRPHYGYDPDDFVAVVAENDENTRFWIGRVKNVTEVDEENRAKKLEIRWYVASGTDPWQAKYTPAWTTVDGEQTVYEDHIEVATVLVRFETLTTTNKLRVRDKKAIKQTLNEN